MTLLRALAPELSEADADRMAAAVGDLPLVVDQAGSLLADTSSTSTPTCGCSGERADELLAQDTGGTYPVSVTASWAVAFDRLAADDPVALDLLTLVAWCGPEPVPVTLITDNSGTLPARLLQLTDPLVRTRAIGILHRRGMATVAPHSIKLHRIPAALLRARTTTDTDNWATAVVRLLRAGVPRHPWDNPEVWPTWQGLLPHVLAATDPARDLDDNVAADVAWLLRRAGQYILTRGQPRTARPLFKRKYSEVPWRACRGAA